MGGKISRIRGGKVQLDAPEDVSRRGRSVFQWDQLILLQM